MLFLARTWFGCSAAELLRRCPDPLEIAEMMAEYELSPWGEIAGDYRAATVGLGIAKATLGHPVNGSDFAVDFSDKTQTPDQMRAVLRGLAGHKGA